MAFMDAETEKRFDTIFQLLHEQREMLDRYWPYTPEQLQKDRELWAQIRALMAEIHSRPTRLIRQL